MPQQISVIGCDFVDDDGLFKATVLWDKIVTHLEESIKCGRHTQSLKTYSNCFQGSKAVDCLLVHLNAVQPKPVRRHQVQTLCQKLILTGVIEDVKDKEKGVFREGRLYRLTRNHFWVNPTERKLPRTRSAEEICTEKKALDCDDLKGYASDSTVSHQVSTRVKPAAPHRKKRKCKERGGGGEGGERADHHKISPPPIGAHFPPLNSGMFKMKSTGSILNAPDYTPSTMLCEFRESLPCLETRHRHKTSASMHHRRALRPESYTLLGTRRGSVDNGIGRVCGACGGGGFKPSRRGGKGKDETRHAGKERMLRCRHQSRSLKGEKDRHRKHSHHEAEELDYGRKYSLNRSLSFSSVGDYEETGDAMNFEPIHHHASTSGSKWIVYGYF